MEPILICGDSRDLSFIKDESVTLMATSPPYNVGKPYSTHMDEADVSDYLQFLNDVWQECVRTLCPGGRMAINVANTWRNPYIPLASYITRQLIDLGLLMRGEVIWNKGASVGVSTAWGSWRSASNPTLRDVHEYILIFCKESAKLISDGRKSDLTSEEFTEFTKSIWTFPTASARREGHPAPFPVELPRRLIKLYTFPGDTVLDPFMGSGTTGIAAVALGRHFIGVDIDPAYVERAKTKVLNVQLPLANNHEAGRDVRAGRARPRESTLDGGS